jgi:hypothetical protein
MLTSMIRSVLTLTHFNVTLDLYCLMMNPGSRWTFEGGSLCLSSISFSLITLLRVHSVGPQLEPFQLMQKTPQIYVAA